LYVPVLRQVVGLRPTVSLLTGFMELLYNFSLFIASTYVATFQNADFTELEVIIQ